MLGRKSEPRVAHGKPEFGSALTPRLESDGEFHLPLHRELDGIAHQVGENLTEPEGIAHELPGDFRRYIEEQLYILVNRLLLDNCDDA